uniref:BTB domain-containing protein n=1 Tax=viral metagenome TaxID=1070528 RepID=A0A6C0C9I6_9ZZZZ
MSLILNVSGKIFRVSRDVISKSEMFKNMLADSTVDGEIMIDRSAKLFEHLYAYLLDDKYPYPKKYYSELDYYLVPYDIDLLYDPAKDIDKLKELMFSMFYKNQEKTSKNSMCPYEMWDYRYSYYKKCDNPCYDEYVCYMHIGSCCKGGCNITPDPNQAYCREHLFD